MSRYWNEDVLKNEKLCVDKDFCEAQIQYFLSYSMINIQWTETSK